MVSLVVLLTNLILDDVASILQLAEKDAQFFDEKLAEKVR